MNRKVLKLSLIMSLLLLVFLPCFVFAEDPDADEGEAAQEYNYDPQDPRVPAMDEPCGENGIPVLYLTVDPDEFENVWQSGEHTYRAPGKIRIVVPEGYEGEYSDSLTPDTGELDLEYIRGRGHSTWKGAKRPFRLKLEKKRFFSEWEATSTGFFWQMPLTTRCSGTASSDTSVRKWGSITRRKCSR